MSYTSSKDYSLQDRILPMHCKRPPSASIPPIGTKHCSSPSPHTSKKEKPCTDDTVTLNRDGDLTCDAGLTNTRLHYSAHMAMAFISPRTALLLSHDG